MKRYILGGLAASALLIAAPLGGASAADMPLKAPPPPPPVMSWTGWYAGVNGGYSWGDWDSSSLAAIFPGGTGARPDVKGWFGGVQAGYNWQVSSQWVLGIEGDFDWSGERARDGYSATTSAPTVGFPAGIGACDVAPICTTTVTTTAANQWKLPWFATLRGRAGVLVEPTWLLYGTAGLAFAGTKFSDASTTTTTITNGVGTIVNPVTGAAGGAPTVVSSAFSETNNRVGVAVGGGVEKSISPNWSVKAEYLFLDFGSHTFLTGTGFDTNIKLIDNIVRVGVNYHFAGP
jgi:outer membrane immunogenic protein